MTSKPETISPLRARMIEDMTVRNLVPATQREYIRAVKKLAAFLQRSPDTATADDLRNFQVHLSAFDRRDGQDPPGAMIPVDMVRAVAWRLAPSARSSSSRPPEQAAR